MYSNKRMLPNNPTPNRMPTYLICSPSAPDSDARVNTRPLYSSSTNSPKDSFQEFSPPFIPEKYSLNSPLLAHTNPPFNIQRYESRWPVPIISLPKRFPSFLGSARRHISRWIPLPVLAFFIVSLCVSIVVLLNHIKFLHLLHYISTGLNRNFGNWYDE